MSTSYKSRSAKHNHISKDNYGDVLLSVFAFFILTSIWVVVLARITSIVGLKFNKPVNQTNLKKHKKETTILAWLLLASIIIIPIIKQDITLLTANLFQICLLSIYLSGSYNKNKKLRNFLVFCLWWQIVSLCFMFIMIILFGLMLLNQRKIRAAKQHGKTISSTYPSVNFMSQQIATQLFV